MTSSDGINWTSRNASENNAWQSISWSPELGVLVAIASDGVNRIMYSYDSINWISKITSENNSWQSICWSPELSLFVGIASNGVNCLITSSLKGRFPTSNNLFNNVDENNNFALKIKYAPLQISSTTTLTANSPNYVIATSSTFTITLPSIQTTDTNGLEFFITNMGTGIITVSVQNINSEKIDNTLTSITLNQYDRIYFLAYTNISTNQFIWQTY
jgi:hypothetical protein